MNRPVQPRQGLQVVRRDKVHEICDVAAGGVGEALLARVVDGGGLDVVLAAVDLVALGVNSIEEKVSLSFYRYTKVAQIQF